jgi:flagellar protein FliL
MTTMRQPPARIASNVNSSSAKNTKGKSAAEGENGGGKTKSKKLKLAVLALVLLLGGAGAAKFTILAPSKSTKPAVKAKAAPGPVIALDEQTLNLDGGHYLRLKVAIETTKGTSEEMEVTEGVQAVIDEFSNRPVAELTGDAARSKARKELLAKLQKIYPKKILDIYYTEFVMQ